MINGIVIDDLNIKYVILNSGEYLIDGELIKVDSWKNERVQCKNINDIRKVTTNKYIKEYRSGDKIMSVEDYKAEKYRLYNKGIKYQSEDYTEWNSLEDEFAYRKFEETWKPIYVETQEVSDPIYVQIDHIKYDTGVKYIRSAFINGIDKDDTLYSYYQAEAWLDIVKECFNELNMEFQPDLSFNATANKKVWSNSNHSCIRYVTAYGNYIMSDLFKEPHIIKGTLDDMMNRYTQDRKIIRNIIKDGYNRHFGSIDANKFDFDSLLSKLNNAINSLHEIRPNSKNGKYYYSAITQINNAINQIKVAYKVSDDDDEDE